MPRPLRLPLTFYDGLAERFVAPYGDDNNDGYDFRYPKKTIIDAYDNLPATGGTINVMDGSYTGGELSKQGLLITAVGTLYPGWRRLKTLRLVGYTGDGAVAQFSGGGARIFPGNPGDGAPYFPADSQFAFWFTGNGAAGGFPIVMENIVAIDLRGGWRIGGNPNPAVDPYGASGMGSDFTTVLFWLRNCSTHYNNDGVSGTAQPGFHIGYVIWGNIENCVSDRPTDAAFDSDRRAGFLVKPSDGSSQLRFSNCRGAQGGIKFYAGTSTWGIDVDWYQIEGDFVNPLPPAVWLIGTNKFGSGVINNATGADAGAGSMNGIVIDGLAKPSQIIVSNATGTPDGPCTTIANAEPNFGNPTGIITPARDNQIAFAGGRIWGDMDFVRQVSPVITNRVYNLCPQHESRNGETGAITNPTIIDHFSNRVWTQSGVVVVGGSGTCVDAPVPDKSGGTTAIQIASNDGDLTLQRLFYAYRVVQPGDRIVVGLWVRFPNDPRATGEPLGLTLTNGALEVTYNVDMLNPMYFGDGQWSFLKGWGKVIALHGETEALVNFVVQNIENGHPIVVDQRACYHIPVGTMSDNEFGAFFQNLASYVQAPLGVATTQPGQRLVAQGGLGVGDAIAMGAHTVGATANLVPIRDAQGNLLGYAELKPLTS